MATITLQEAQASLPQIIHALKQGEELLITEDDRPVAKLVGAPSSEAPKPRRFGTLRGTVLRMEPFGDPLEDFQEYMT